MALLIAQFLPRSDPGLGADASALASGAGAGTSVAPGSSPEPGMTFGPIVDPSLAIDATRPPRPAVTLPPTGSFEPGETDGPTPRPSKKPPPTVPPATPKPTPEPTPEITPIPPPVAAFSWSATLLIVTFTDGRPMPRVGSRTSVTGRIFQRNPEHGRRLHVLVGWRNRRCRTRRWAYLDARGTFRCRRTGDGDDGSQATDSDRR